MEKRQFADASTYLGAKSPRCGAPLYIYLHEVHNSTRTGGEIGWKWTIKGKDTINCWRGGERGVVMVGISILIEPVNQREVELYGREQFLVDS